VRRLKERLPRRVGRRAGSGAGRDGGHEVHCNHPWRGGANSPDER
jgi:hypothetical protein